MDDDASAIRKAFTLNIKSMDSPIHSSSFLVGLVLEAQNEGIRTDVTLFIGGVIICGEVTSIEEFEIGSRIKYTEDFSKVTLEESQVECIHINASAIIQGGVYRKLSAQTFYRFNLRSVDGFGLGTLTPASDSGAPPPLDV